MLDMASPKRFNGKYNLFCGVEINGKHVFWKDLMENRFSLENLMGNILLANISIRCQERRAPIR